MALIVLDVCVHHAADSLACCKEIRKINVCWKSYLFSVFQKLNSKPLNKFLFQFSDRLCATPRDGDVCPFLSNVTFALQLSLKWASF